MSPLVIVGQLIFLCLLGVVTGDVSHVIRGGANSAPNTNAQAVNSLVIAHDGKQSASGEFWWQNGDSPLKTAYDQFKNCRNGGAGTSCSLQHHENVVKFNGELQSANGLTKIDLSKNPFFNGNVTSRGNAAASAVRTTQTSRLDLSKNPFFSGHGQIIDDNGEGFLGVQPAEIKFAKPKPFSLSHPLSGDCSGSGAICVPVNKCGKDGYTTASFAQDVLQIGNKQQKCNQKTEICCRVATSKTGFSGITPGKSSILSFKKSGLFQVLPNGDELRPDVHSAGESGAAAGFNIISTTAKPIRDVTFNPIFSSSTVDYSNTVFGDVRFASTIKGPDYLPPYEQTPPPTTKTPYIPPPPPPQCPIGQRLINGRCQCTAPNTRLQNGICVPISTPPPPPSCPYDQQLINGICQCTASNTYLENGRCIPRRTPPPPPPPTPGCPYDQRLVNSICQCTAPNMYLENGRCIPRRTPPPPPPPTPGCPYDQRLVNGICQCSAPNTYLENGRCTPRRTPPPPPPPTPGCPYDQRLVNGICQCTAPNTYLENGRCIPRRTPPPPPPPTPGCPYDQRLVNGICQCTAPNTYLENGRCIPRRTPPPPPPPTPSCPYDQYLVNGICLCTARNTRLENGICVPIRPPPTPPPIVCSFNEQFINGRCVPRVTTGYLPPDTTTTTRGCPYDQQLINGRCQCVGSNTRLQNGVCVAITTTTPPTPPPCSSDQRYVNGRCECIARNSRLENGRCVPIITCSFNERLINGRCVPVPTPPPPPKITCTFGEQLVNGRCISTTTGYTYTTPKITFPTPAPCGIDQRYVNGRCECTTSNTKIENGRCVPIITINCGYNERLVNGRCILITTPPPPKVICAFGEQLVNGRCVPTTTGYTYSTPRIPFPTPTPAHCPNDQRYVNGRCECTASNTKIENGRCVLITVTCGYNERLVNGRCVSIPTPSPPPRVTCAFGEQFVNGRCVGSTTGYTYTTPSIPFPTPAPCGHGQRRVNGRCECIDSNNQLENGRCVPIITINCGFNERLVNGRCIPIPTPSPPPRVTCAFGEQFVNGRCVGSTTGYTYTTPSIPFPTPAPCGHGQRRVNGRCECIDSNNRLENGRCVPIVTINCGFNERLVNGRCIPIPTPSPPPRVTCAFGEQFVNGRCVGSTTGYTYTTPSIPFPTPAPCGHGQRRVNGRCECIDSSNQLENGRCVPIITINCGFNERLVNGRCIPIPTPSPPPRVTCAFGEQFVNGRCVGSTTGYTYTTPSIPFPTPAPCGHGQRRVNGRCECTDSSNQLENGRCVPIVTINCGFNERLVNGRCIPIPTPSPPPRVTCAFGEQFVNGRCVGSTTGYTYTTPSIPFPTPAPCGHGQRRVNGRCECIDSNNRLENGRCVPIVTINCGFNERLVNGRCIPIPTPSPPPRVTCAFGEQFVNGRCVGSTTGYTYTTPSIPFPTPAPCGHGQRRVNGRCECIDSNNQLENGRCVPIITINCGFNERLVNGRCIPIPTPSPPPRVTCAFGEQFVNGRCVGSTTGYTYTTPSIPFPTPAPCGHGQRRVNGRCECIDSNNRLENGRCVPIITINCGFNERLVNGRCIPIPTPSPPPRVTCAFGEQFVNGRCVGSTTGYTYTTPSIPFPTPAPCGHGQRRVNGRCECTDSSNQLENGRCVPIITINCGFNERLVNGRCIPIPTPSPPPRVTCAFGEQFVNGRCVGSTTGYTYTTPSIPFPTPAPCGHGQRRVNGRCECIDSNNQLENGRCVPIITINCGFNERLVNGRCIPIPTPSPPPRVTCAFGEQFVNGRCVGSTTGYTYTTPSIPFPTPAPCGHGQQRVNGRCECIDSNNKLENGRCVTVTCGFNERLVNGRCVPIPTPPPPSRVTCAVGEQLVNGRCVAITTGYTYTTPRIPFPTPAPCGNDQRYVNGRCECAVPNTRLENGRCVPIITINCGFNERLVNGRCITLTTPTPPSCGSGQRYINGRCECVDSNSYFENGACVIRPTPPPPSCPANTYLLNGRCVPTQPKGPEGGYIYEKPDKNFDSSNTVSVNVRPTPPPNTYIPVTETTGSTFKNNYITDPTTRTTPEPIPEGNMNINVIERLSTPGPQHVSGCAAALKCVQEIYCTPEGFISPVPVVFSKEQLDNRVPLANCTILDTASEGKCCRDPNYKDPWPSANLINGVDNGQYREDNALGQYFPDKQRAVRSGVLPSQKKRTETESTICGARNYNTQPKANLPPEVNFGEIPWQAMILRDSSRTLLCGGAIISPNVVLTMAHCIDGIESKDILVKGGEWKLGVDEEPQPFQIVKVAAVARHPNYRAGNLTNDLAVLLLSEKLRLTGNVGTLCLSQQPDTVNDKCIVTGWGKKVLQVHLKNALMHAIDAEIINEEECRENLATKYDEFLPNLGPNVICARSKQDQCKVDYGSAMACEDSNGQYHLAGIFSWDTGCKDGNQIGGYIRPDQAWIQKSMRSPVRQLRKLERDFLAQQNS